MFNSFKDALKDVVSDSPQKDDGSDGEEQGEESRVQLLAKIQSLLERNERYETRFRDVVGAYKNTLKEKAALESTLNALTSEATAGGEDDDDNDDYQDAEDGADEGGAAAGGAGDDASADGGGPDDGDAAAAAGTGAGDSKLKQARKSKSTGGGGASSAELKAAKVKVTTLAKALSTLTEEKNVMEARFQKDKKTVADAHRTAMQQLTEDTVAKEAALTERANNAEAEREVMKTSMQQLTEQLLSGHQDEKAKAKEWEKERRKHRDELKKVSHSKSANDKSATKVLDLEDQLRVARDNEVEALEQLSTGTAELKDQVLSLEDQLAVATKELSAARSKGDGDVVLRLKHELSKATKAAERYQAAAQQAVGQQEETARSAQIRIEASEAKNEILMEARTEKDVGASRELMLQESRLTELSSLVGRYEAARLTDSHELQGLRDENAELMDRLQAVEDSGQESESGGNGNGGGGSYSSMDSASRIALLEQEVERLQKRLQSAQLANQRRLADNDLDDEGMMDLTSAVAPPWHGVVLHGGELPLDVQEARDVADGLYEKACEALAAKKECAAKLKKTADAYRATAERLEKVVRENAAEASAAEDGFRYKLEAFDTASRAKEAQAETDHTNVVRRMTKRAQKVRERTLELLEERDAEIARLRGKAGAAATSPPGSPSKPKPKRVVRRSMDNASAARALSPALGGGAGGVAAVATPKSDGMGTGGKLIYNALEAHERGREMSTARRQLRDLEIALDDATFKEELLQDQNEALKDEIRRLDANAAREGANLEYLKNVFVKYMTEDTGKEQSFLAISAILQFSRKEVAAIKPKAVPSTGSITNWFSAK